MNRSFPHLATVSDPPTFSIITVCFNNLSGLRKTADSIEKLTSIGTFEWIVIDGGSTDGTAAFLKNLRHCTKYVSEPDGGIFDAMQKGVNFSFGQYLVFMNSGDQFYDEGVLERTQACIGIEAPEILYGDSYEIDDRTLHYKPARAPRWNKYAMFTHHQSQFYKRSSVLQAGGYDMSYKLSADWVLTTRILRGGRAKYVGSAVSIFERGGVSQGQEHRRTMDRELFRIYREEQKHPALSAAVLWLLKVSINKVRAYLPGVYDAMRYPMKRVAS